MRFGYLARVITALALLVLAVFTLKVFFHQPVTVVDPHVVGKQALPQKALLPDFAAISDIREKKRAFFDFIRPGVRAANRDIALNRQFLLDLQHKLKIEENFEISPSSYQRYSELAQYYQHKSNDVNADSIAKLLSRVDIIPEELVMVQAANESGWGTSRFARLGLNFFGQWCFTQGCGLIPQSRNEGANHEVRVFDSVDQSIASYLRNLNTHPAYQHLREIRLELRQNNLEVNPEHLAPGLLNYSERQHDYVIELLQMLRHNKAFL
ncbi:glucosaminidase domain-containing protein [Psychrobium sp. 1_MG-2023]|uniref:glucosaminidase domain-containing protein n=1 Tax=Psychrobium sp. 1_MG-2023 TaxID=3062624 RepID=UPI000C3286AE|nr:glucosaminidase domain-containing protein [Psychrobium sp. 1_MG-2023]MDP2561539.1 glucosaminidase domain-containing protein [Psychrobium sp. 1_MG-2023]PKF55002.1 glucosaminidase [Alteromonadales bacterium alter-6D02]